MLIAAVATGAALVRGLVVRAGGWSAPHLLAFAGGTMLCAIGVFLFQRGLRQQARLRAIAELMPHVQDRWRSRSGVGAGRSFRSFRPSPANDAWHRDGSEWSDDLSDAPLAHAEMRAATRALLVSLEDELRQETTSRRERTAHSACRRARLRAAGRAKAERRRRVVVPSARSLS